jgi:hypothetical protein
MLICTLISIYLYLSKYIWCVSHFYHFLNLLKKFDPKSSQPRSVRLHMILKTDLIN